MKEQMIHEKAIRLIEGGQVVVGGHLVRMEHDKYITEPYHCCDIDYSCSLYSEMYFICKECDKILKKDCFLKLVNNDKEIKQ